jgi:trans-aconitate 2-methyltransferase
MPEAFANADAYAEQCAYVWKHGAGLVELLAPQPGEGILDLGCGTGRLTAEIAAAGAKTLGLDASPAMIERARTDYPHLEWRVADARDFTVETRVDAVFSNAALHWVRPPEPAARCIFTVLKPGGRFIAEFGGAGNVTLIIAALEATFVDLGVPERRELHPWYFPSIGDYATLLEQVGFSVEAAWLFDRPTRLDGEEAGLRNWLQVFGAPFLEGLDAKTVANVIAGVERRLRPLLWQEDAWFADYRRLRLVARRSSG